MVEFDKRLKELCESYIKVIRYHDDSSFKPVSLMRSNIAMHLRIMNISMTVEDYLKKEFKFNTVKELRAEGQLKN